MKSESQTQDERDAANREVDNVIDGCRALLVSHAGDVQGAVLCELTAMWLAGHPDYSRQALFEVHTEHTLGNIRTHEKILYGKDGHPLNKGTTDLFSGTALGEVMRLMQTMINAHGAASEALEEMQELVNDPADLADVVTARALLLEGNVSEATDVLAGIEGRL
jgi:hypothetical protein